MLRFVDADHRNHFITVLQLETLEKFRENIAQIQEKMERQQYGSDGLTQDCELNMDFFRLIFHN